MQRRHVRAPLSPGVQLGLIITPMLDLAFQLLAFFILTYRPPPMESRLLSAEERIVPGSLKEAKDTPAISGLPKPPDKKDPKVTPQPDPDPNVEPAYWLTVKSSGASGEPTWIELKRPESAKPDSPPISDGRQKVEEAMKRLSEKLSEVSAAHRKHSPGSKLVLELRVDGSLKYRYLIEIQDRCRGARFDEVYFTQPTK
jgi:biopolymer transport protein ExbD